METEHSILLSQKIHDSFFNPTAMITQSNDK